MADEITIGKEVAGVRTGLGGLIDTIKSSAKETEIAYGEHRKAIKKISEDSQKSSKELDDGLVKTSVELKETASRMASFEGDMAEWYNKADQAWLSADQKLADGMVGLGDMWLDLATTPDFAAVFDDMLSKMPDLKFAETLGKGGDAIKELTGGLIDINDIVDTGMKKVKAGFDLVTMPIKLLNDGITKVMGAFGVEIDLLQKGKELLVKGMKKMAGAFFKVAGALIKNAVLFLGRVALFMLGLAFQGLAFLVALPGMLFGAGIYVAGLIASGLAMAAAALPMLAAAAPIIGIALLIGLGVAALVWAGMKLYDMFIENKDFIYAKFNSMWKGVKGVIGTIVGFFTNIWQSISDFIKESFLKMKSFLGLTSDEEEKELEGIKQRKADKAANREAAQKGAEEALANDSVYLAADDRTKRKMLKDKEAELFKLAEAQTEFNNMDTQALIDERTAKQEELEGKLAVMVERQEFIDKAQADGNAEVMQMQQNLDEEARAAFLNNRITHNGKVLEGDEKKAFIETQLADKRAAIESKIKANEAKLVDMKERASLGILRDEEGEMVGGEEFAYAGTAELEGDTTALADDVNMMQGSLEQKEDYVPSIDLTDAQVAQKMGYTEDNITQAYATIPSDGSVGLIEHLEQMVNDGTIGEDSYLGEGMTRDLMEGQGDTTTDSAGAHARLLQDERVNLETTRMGREFDEADATAQQVGNMAVVQNNANTVNTTTRMQDPLAINRLQSGSWGGGSSMGDSALEF